VTAKVLLVAIVVGCPLYVGSGFSRTIAFAVGPPAVTTLVGTGVPGYSDLQVNNPYGLVIGPDGGLYFCDLDNQRIRRFDFATKRLTTVAGSGERGYRGDGGPATAAALNMPHELRFDRIGNLFIAERDNHVIRKVDRATGLISTVAGTGTDRNSPSATGYCGKTNVPAFELIVFFEGASSVSTAPTPGAAAATPATPTSTTPGATATPAAGTPATAATPGATPAAAGAAAATPAPATSQPASTTP